MHNDVGCGSLGIQERNPGNPHGERRMALQSTRVLPSTSPEWDFISKACHGMTLCHRHSLCARRHLAWYFSFCFGTCPVVFVLRWDQNRRLQTEPPSFFPTGNALPSPASHFSLSYCINNSFLDCAYPLRDGTDGPGPLARTGSASVAA